LGESPILLSLIVTPDDSIARSSPLRMLRRGAFRANLPGS